jgi:hypothetical protein
MAEDIALSLDLAIQRIRDLEDQARHQAMKLFELESAIRALAVVDAWAGGDISSCLVISTVKYTNRRYGPKNLAPNTSLLPDTDPNAYRAMRWLTDQFATVRKQYGIPHPRPDDVD